MASKDKARGIWNNKRNRIVSKSRRIAEESNSKGISGGIGCSKSTEIQEE